jgi:iron complex transport system substrate-binding protein
MTQPRYRHIRRVRYIILPLLIALLCTLSAAATDYPVTVNDSLGNDLTIEEEPERIVLAGKATLLTASVFYLFPEAREKVVAIGKTNQGLGNFIPHLDPSFEKVNQLSYDAGPEQVAAQKPDLLIVKDFVYRNLGRQAERLGIPVLPLSLESPAAYRRDIRVLGRILNSEQRAEEIWGYYRENLNEITEVTDDLSESEKPRTLILYYSTRGGEVAFNIPPASWIQTYQVKAAGGWPVWTGSHSGRGWKTVSFEQIAAWDPDRIYITSYNLAPDNFMQKILDNPQWQQLRATKEGRVQAFPADFYSWAQPETRWILGIQWLAHQLHPDLFAAGQDMQEEIVSFYRTLYGLDRSAVQSLIMPRLEGAVSD